MAKWPDSQPVERCRNCAVDGQVNDRLDVWQTARTALANAEWGTEYVLEPADVITLALFLTGELPGGIST